jgi:beta-galactosidase/beta-glucuronidase
MSPVKRTKISAHIKTPWYDDVDPQLPHPEYPRPQMVREGWQNLNGIWRYAITPDTAGMPESFPGKILVPFPIESALSGVEHHLQPDERLWYRRNFHIDKDWKGGHVLLHFGAVDWYTQVFINDHPVGAHKGGYDPFTFDITSALAEGENDLVVSVLDPSDSQPIQRGKQVLKPGFIWYTSVSGIWQTVWLEYVPETYIESIRITPDIEKSCVKIECRINTGKPHLTIRACVLENGKGIAEVESSTDAPLSLSLQHPKLWSPDSPHLYDLELSLRENGEVVDRIRSYFGMRKFSMDRDGQGHMRFCLNDKPLFLYGPLDQGYWPDGLYTPPTDEAMLWEVNFIKDAGFNMLRKHIKVEPARYYYHCDKTGLIVWQDMVSGGISPRPIWFLFAKLFKSMHDDRCYWRLGRGSEKNRAGFKKEYQRMIDALYNVASISIWGPFNEGWGQFDASEIAAWTKSYDPTRLVDHASGWFDQGAGDFSSSHVYFKSLPGEKLNKRRASVLSEFGGYSLNLIDHAWNPEKYFGYRKFQNSADLTAGYSKLLTDQLIPWIKSGLSAAVYTQTTDVESEVNGFLTYDRKVLKMDLDTIRQAHMKLYSESPE